MKLPRDNKSGHCGGGCTSKPGDNAATNILHMVLPSWVKQLEDYTGDVGTCVILGTVSVLSAVALACKINYMTRT